ncbi:hypothetical protein ACHAXT_008949 [Thalassiosira profunda]
MPSSRIAPALLRPLRRGVSSGPAATAVNPFAAASSAASCAPVTPHMAAASLLSPLDYILSCLPKEESEGCASQQK